MAWQVASHIRATPSGLVLKADAGSLPHQFFLRSEDRPFRILRVSGSVLARLDEPLPEVAQPVHRLALILKPDSSGASDIRFTTDHPDQPTVTVSVLILPSAGGAE